MKAAGIVACLAGIAVAAPSYPRNAPLIKRAEAIAKRQLNPEAAAGLTDPDILNFALSLEWLEGKFYTQGVQTLGREAFLQAGLTDAQVDGIIEVGQTELDHASLLQGAIAQAGFKPAEPCQYNFQFTDPISMAQTASILESVGVGAYLFAAQLVSSAGILTTAGSILTVEARHQTFLRTVLGQQAIPLPFDAALSPRMAFSLAAPFVASCNDGSNLNIPPFATLTQVQPPAGSVVAIDSQMVFQCDQLAASTHCAFVSGGVPGGAVFSPIDATGGCIVPQNIGGVVFVALSNQAPIDGTLPDDIVTCGPVGITVS